MPPGAIHGFANTSASPATLLIMFCPADAREKYFQSLADLTRDGRQPSRNELIALMRLFDQEPIEQVEFP